MKYLHIRHDGQYIYWVSPMYAYRYKSRFGCLANKAVIYRKLSELLYDMKHKPRLG